MTFPKTCRLPSAFHQIERFFATASSSQFSAVRTPLGQSPGAQQPFPQRERFFVAMPPKMDLSGYQYSAMVSGCPPRPAERKNDAD